MASRSRTASLLSRMGTHVRAGGHRPAHRTPAARPASRRRDVPRPHLVGACAHQLRAHPRRMGGWRRRSRTSPCWRNCRLHRYMPSSSRVPTPAPGPCRRTGVNAASSSARGPLGLGQDGWCRSGRRRPLRLGLGPPVVGSPRLAQQAVRPFVEVNGARSANASSITRAVAARVSAPRSRKAAQRREPGAPAHPSAVRRLNSSAHPRPGRCPCQRCSRSRSLMIPSRPTSEHPVPRCLTRA